MWTPRLIPLLLLRGRSLVKTVRFDGPRYVGDPITAVQIFNEKEVDEVIVLDIEATPQSRGPNLELVESIACQCFMPLSYGGGVNSTETMERLFAAGVEKVVVNTALAERPDLIESAASQFGSQSIVASIDVKSRRLGRREVRVRGGKTRTGMEPVTFARQVEAAGAGEIMVTSIDRDGTRSGYDVDLVRSVTDAVGVPVIASGGAGGLEDVREVLVTGGATAAAIGSLVVFHGRQQAVLINFPDRAAVRSLTRTVDDVSS